MVMRVSVKNLTFSYGSTQILHGIDLSDLPAGRVIAVIGPNAAGKSTFFKCLAGLLCGDGEILFNDRDSRQMTRSAINQHVTYLPQETTTNAVLTVFEAVLLARQHSASWRVNDDDLRAALSTLEALEIGDLALRYLNELSGGQRQVVAIAQALARDPEFLILDEPTNNLDLQRQLEVLYLVRSITIERGITTMIALHDLNLAARFADHVVVLSDGRVYAEGSPDVILTAEMLHEIYGIRATVITDHDGFPIVIPLSSVRQTTERHLEALSLGLSAR